MSPRHAAACERCGEVGEPRWIADLLQGQISEIGVFLCDKCYTALERADARAWEWFREYRDHNMAHDDPRLKKK